MIFTRGLQFKCEKIDKRYACFEFVKFPTVFVAVDLCIGKFLLADTIGGAASVGGLPIKQGKGTVVAN